MCGLQDESWGESPQTQYRCHVIRHPEPEASQICKAFVGRLPNDACSALQGQLHSQPRDHPEKRDLFAISIATLMEDIKVLGLPVHFPPTDEQPRTIADLCTAGVYACDCQEMMYAAPKRTLNHTFLFKHAAG